MSNNRNTVFDVPAAGGGRRSLTASFSDGGAPQVVVGRKTWYVDATRGSDNNTGVDRTQPFATIGKAVTAASDGDVIRIAQGTYAERVVITGKNDLVLRCDTPVGRGITFNARPNIAPATGVALTLAQCRRIWCDSLYFYSVDDVAVLLDSEGCTFHNCESSSDAAEEYKLLCATDKDFTGSGTSWLGCILDSGVNGIKNYTATAAGHTGQATNCVVEDCDFYGHSAADIADEAGAAQNYWDGWRVTANRFMSKAKAVYLAMGGGAGSATTNCFISDNDFAAVDALDATMIALTSGAVFTNNRNAIGVVDGHTF